jgi:hypothetical protein
MISLFYYCSSLLLQAFDFKLQVVYRYHACSLHPEARSLDLVFKISEHHE